MKVKMFNILEAYRPKTNNLKYAEKEISEIIKYTNARFVSGNTSESYNDNKHVQLLADYLAKDTGCKKITLSISPSASFNAMTIPMVSYIFGGYSDKTMLIESEGAFSLKNANIHIFITASVFSGKFTESEILAIVLHEIGHNVDGTFANILSSIYNTIISKGTVAIQQVGLRAFLKGLDSIQDKSQVKSGKSADIYRRANKVNAVISNIHNILSIPLAVLLLPRTLIDYINPMRWFVGKSKERFADKYASDRGYAVPLASAFKKFGECSYDNNTDTINGLPSIIRIIYDLNYAALVIVSDMRSPHDPTYIRNELILKNVKANISGLSNSVTKTLLIKEVADIELIQLQALSPNTLFNKDRPFSLTYKKIQSKL